MTGPWGAPQPKPGQRPARKGSRLGLFLWLGVIGVGLGCLLALGKLFPGSVGEDDAPYMVRNLGLLILISSSILFVRDIKWKRAALQIGLWLAVGVVLLLGYAYQEELGSIGTRLHGAVVPGYAVQTGINRMDIAESQGGDYSVYGTVNGAKIRFMVDTGASDIVLTPADARRAGLDVGSLKFDKAYGTANGVGYGASVLLDEITVGGIRFTHVRASVNATEIGVSLLGMAFLRRLKSFNFADRKLVLTW